MYIGEIPRLRVLEGEWLPYLDREFGWADRTARNFINVAENFKLENFSDLSIGPSALYLLASPSTPESAREEAVAQAEAGKTQPKAYLGIGWNRIVENQRLNGVLGRG